MTVREVVAVIVIERDERGHYFASTTHEGVPLKDDCGGWYTLLGSLDNIGQMILEAQKLIFPRARFPSFKPDSPP